LLSARHSVGRLDAFMEEYSTPQFRNTRMLNNVEPVNLWLFFWWSRRAK